MPWCTATRSTGVNRAASASQLRTTDSGQITRCGPGQRGEVGERGGGLAEAHVVGEAAAEADPVEELQPAEAAPLVRPQRGHESGGLDPLGQRGVGKTLQQITEPTGGGNRRHASASVGSRLLGGRQFGGETQ